MLSNNFLKKSQQFLGKNLTSARPESAVISGSSIPKRNMMLHEYQAAQMLHKYRIPIPLGQVAFSSKEAFVVARQFGGDFAEERKFVVKAQVNCDGRSKGYFEENGFMGGIQHVKGVQGVADVAAKMIGKRFINDYTDPEGIICKCVYIMEELNIDKKLFINMKLCQKTAKGKITFSNRGGLNLKQMQDYPEDIHEIYVDLMRGVDLTDLYQVSQKMGLDQRYDGTMAFIVRNMFELFIVRDCSEVAIHPLILTKEGTFRAANPKMKIDKKAYYRQSELLSKFDFTQMDKLQRLAFSLNLRYDKIPDENGNIGLMTNGYGLSLATQMQLKTFDRGTVNHLDLYGDSTIEDVIEGLELLQEDSRVKIVMMNLFAGQLSLKPLAEGVVKAIDRGSFSKPLVMRLRGQNESIATSIIKDFVESQSDDSPLKGQIYIEDDFDKAIEKAAQMAEDVDKQIRKTIKTA